MTQRDLIADLTAEAEPVDQLLDGLSELGWQRPTPAPGWTVADQIAHLAFIFRLAGTAAAERRRRSADDRRGRRRLRGRGQRGAQEFRHDQPEVLARPLAGRAGRRDQGARRRAAGPVGALAGPPAAAGRAGLRRHHGGLRPRPGHRRRARRDAASRPTGSGTSPGSPRCTLGLRLPVPRPARRRTCSSASRSPRPPASCGTSARRTPSSGSPARPTDFCLLVTRRRHRDDLALTRHRRGRRARGSTSRRPTAGRPARAAEPGQFSGSGRPTMAVRGAVRGAIQVDRDDPAVIVAEHRRAGSRDHPAQRARARGHHQRRCSP